MQSAAERGSERIEIESESGSKSLEIDLQSAAESGRPVQGVSESQYSLEPLPAKHTLEKNQTKAHTGEKSNKSTHWRKVKRMHTMEKSQTSAIGGGLASVTLLAPFNVLPHCQVHLV